MADEPIPEEWRPVIDHPGYEISDSGRVRSINRVVEYPANRRQQAHSKTFRGRMLSVTFSMGYPRVNLEGNFKERVHVLVCLTFHGPKPSENYMVAHWDGDRTNCHKTNLRWATQAENEQDKIRHGRYNRKGSESSSAKLTEKDVITIRKWHKQDKPMGQTAKRFGVSRATICLVVNRKRWAHVP